MDTYDFLSSSLALPVSAIAYAVSEKTASLFPERAVLEGVLEYYSLINAKNRSFFLNELDGFAANTGVVALATTNHPERLDASIFDRPSRFDRTYHFDLPGPAERLAYVRLWATSLREALRPSEAGLESVVGQTEGFSFAYLKELFLSAMMRWIAAPGDAVR